MTRESKGMSENLCPASVPPRRLKICFVGLYAYSLFNRETRFPFGGAEVRAMLFSTGLARIGHYDVSFVVMDHGQAAREAFEGVLVYSHTGYRSWLHKGWQLRFAENIERSGGVLVHSPRFPYRRVTTRDPRLLIQYALLRLHMRWSSFRRSRFGPRSPRLSIRQHIVEPSRFLIYDEVDADVYCVLGVTNLTGEVAAYCRHHGRKFVLFLADITNLDQSYQMTANGKNTYGDDLDICYYSLASADLIVTQLESQRELLQERFGLRGITIRNPVDLAVRQTVGEHRIERNVALWIGRADNFKKMPALLLELARACPDISFVMVMNAHIKDMEQRINRQKPDNVTVLPYVPYQEIEQLFAKAFVFVSTSLTEGFPNTFLQAGKYAVPLLSYQVDPDGFIAAYKCGIVANGNFNAFVAGLRRIRADENSQRHYGCNNRKYVERFHALDERVKEVEVALMALTHQGSTLSTPAVII